METPILYLIIVFLLLMNAYDRKSSNDRQDKLVAALISRNLGEYALYNKEQKTSAKDKLKLTKAENELAIAAQNLVDGQKGEVRLPVG